MHNPTPSQAPPVAVHCKSRHIDRRNYVYVGRPSKWGNPYQIGPDGDRATVIAKYRHYLYHRPDLIAALPELTGKQLGCWCKPAACHADVLIAAWHYYVGSRPAV
jgi:hypothetical protein